MFVWEQVALFVADRPNGVTRKQVAEAFGISKSTALHHLEKAVARGRAVKTYTWAQHASRGWVYYGKVEDNA